MFGSFVHKPFCKCYDLGTIAFCIGEDLNFGRIRLIKMDQEGIAFDKNKILVKITDCKACGFEPVHHFTDRG